MVGAVGLALVSAACGTADQTVLPSVPVAAVRDQASAAALARRLVGRAVLPPGSTIVATPPSVALERPPQVPGFSNLAQTTRFATTARSTAATISFLSAHRPKGYTVDGSGTGSIDRHGVAIVEDMTFQLSGMPPGVYSADLLISVTSRGGGGSGIRVDAQVVWQLPKAAAATVPAGDTVAIVAVTESFPQRRSGPLAPRPRRVVVTRPAEVAILRAAADGLPPFPPLGGPDPGCPTDSGTYIVAFATSTTARANITFTTGPCGGVSVSEGGRLVAGLAGDQAFTRAFEQILGAVSHS